VRRAVANGYNAFCLTVDTDSYSRRERDIAKRHQRRRVRVDDARIYQARFNWRDIERIKRLSTIPVIIKGIATAEDAKIGYPPARVWGVPTSALWAYRIGPARAKRLLLTHVPEEIGYDFVRERAASEYKGPIDLAMPGLRIDV